MKNKDIAVLMIAFRRVDCARQTFEAIKAARPGKFYFYSNCPRPDHPEECESNRIVRDLVKEVDWPCELKTWFRDSPVGVFDSVRLAIDWVFKNEERAIVMEEDCVGAPAWFDFASEMLEKYEDNNRVWMIGGTNYAENYNPRGYSYHFTRNFFCYGWASWRSRWNQIDWKHLDFNKLVEGGLIDAYCPDNKYRKFNKRRIRLGHRFAEENLQWEFANWYAGMEHFAYCITPSRHLVQNIGTEGANQGPLAKLRGKKLDIPFNPITYHEAHLDTSHPPIYVCPENDYDAYVYKVWLSKWDIWYIDILRKIYRVFYPNK